MNHLTDEDLILELKKLDERCNILNIEIQQIRDEVLDLSEVISPSFFVFRYEIIIYNI